MRFSELSMSFATTDLCDDNPHLPEDGRLAVLPPRFQHFGLRRSTCLKAKSTAIS